MSNVLVVPRWAGDASSDWYPWLVQRIEAASGTAEVVPLRPHPDAPQIGPSVSELAQSAEAGTGPVVLVGHSVGCQVVLRYLASGASPRVKAVVLVAGWFEVDSPWPEILPWIETAIPPLPPVPLDVHLSDNDPFTADFTRNRARWEALGARVSVHPGAAHFNRSAEPAVLAAVEAAVRR